MNRRYLIAHKTQHILTTKTYIFLIWKEKGMRKNILIIAFVILMISFFMIFIGIAGLQNALESKRLDFTDSGKYDEAIQMYSGIAGLGTIFLFIGIPIGIIGAVLKSKEKKQTEELPHDRYCPDCGRSIPFDANICPYCKKDFDAV